MSPEVGDTKPPCGIQGADTLTIRPPSLAPFRTKLTEEPDADAVDGTLPPKADLARFPLLVVATT